jgi:hypothetical protein
MVPRLSVNMSREACVISSRASSNHFSERVALPVRFFLIESSAAYIPASSPLGTVWRPLSHEKDCSIEVPCVPAVVETPAPHTYSLVSLSVMPEPSVYACMSFGPMLNLRGGSKSMVSVCGIVFHVGQSYVTLQGALRHCLVGLGMNRGREKYSLPLLFFSCIVSS